MTSENGLDPKVLTLLRESFESFEQLEVLLLLCDGTPTAWTSESVGEKLRIPPAVAGAALEHLYHCKLLQRSEQAFRYAPSVPALADDIALLKEAYAERRIDVITVLSSNAVDRIRTSAIHLFAGAFLFGRRKKKDG